VSGRIEFPTCIDRASYFIPTVGIVALASIAAAIVGMVVGMAAAGRGSEPPGETAFFSWVIAAGAGGGAWWVRRRWRIHHERKLVIDREGIFYVAFAGRPRVMRWHDIKAITEEEEYGPDEGRSLIVRHAGGRFIIRDSDFHGYGEIRMLASEYLAGRTVLLERH
jgi:hypothetical protein